MAQAANAQAMLSEREALTASLELAIEKLKREVRGRRSERTARLIDQMELSHSGIALRLDSVAGLRNTLIANSRMGRSPSYRPMLSVAFLLTLSRPGAGE